MPRGTRVDRQTQHAYNAACSAVLAASGKAKGDPPPDESTESSCGGKPVSGLNAELSEWESVDAAGPAQLRAQLTPTLTHWKSDADLAGIRDESELAKLSADERGTLKRLWAAVDELLAKLEPPAKPPG